MIVKLFNRLDQAQIAFLNQVQKQHAAPYITLRNADNQTQIGLCQTLLGLFIAVSHPFRKIHFFFCGQKRNLSNLFQVHADRILNADAIRHAQVDLFHIHIVFFRNDDIHIVDIIILVAADPQDINVIGLQMFEHSLHLLGLKFHIREEIIDFL